MKLSKIGSAASEEKSFENVNGRMDGRKVITIAHPEQSSGELKSKQNYQACKELNAERVCRQTKRQLPSHCILDSMSCDMTHRGPVVLFVFFFFPCVFIINV